MQTNKQAKVKNQPNKDKGGPGVKGIDDKGKEWAWRLGPHQQPFHPLPGALEIPGAGQALGVGLAGSTRFSFDPEM